LLNSDAAALGSRSEYLRETNCSYLAGADSSDSDSFFANEIESDEEQKGRSRHNNAPTGSLDPYSAGEVGGPSVNDRAYSLPRPPPLNPRFDGFLA
jgi:hypothetical protein